MFAKGMTIAKDFGDNLCWPKMATPLQFCFRQNLSCLQTEIVILTTQQIALKTFAIAIPSSERQLNSIAEISVGSDDDRTKMA